MDPRAQLRIVQEKVRYAKQQAGKATRSHHTPQLPWYATARGLCAVIGIILLIFSGLHWWGIQSALTENRLIALAYSVGLTLVPPLLASFILPWSPGARLFAKINAKGLGYSVIICSACFYVYYTYTLQYSWWLAQPVVAEAGMAQQQAILDIFLFIIFPGIVWMPVTREELVEMAYQEHMLHVYDLQTKTQLAEYRAMLMQAQAKTLKGVMQLASSDPKAAKWIAEIPIRISQQIDEQLKLVSEDIRSVAGVALPFEGLWDNTDLRDTLEYFADMIDPPQLPEPEEEYIEVAPVQKAKLAAATPMQAPTVSKPHPTEQASKATTGWPRPCKWCGEEFMDGGHLGGHMSKCSMRPKKA
jgi:hypothetical protein